MKIYSIIFILLIFIGDAFCSEYLITTRLTDSLDGPEVRILKTCEQENVAVFVSDDLEPIEGAVVKLFKHDDGRRLVATVYSNRDGYAYFSPQEYGVYDITAQRTDVQRGEKKDKFYTVIDEVERKEYYEGTPTIEYQYKRIYQNKEDYNSDVYPKKKDFGQIRFQMPRCKSIEKNVLSEVKREGQGKMIASFSYGQSSRVFEQVFLPDSRSAIKVTVVYYLLDNSKSSTLIESMPKDLEISERTIGFDENYPDQIDKEEGRIIWELSDYESSGGPIKREYYLYRIPSFEQMENFEINLESEEVDKKDETGTKGGIIEWFFSLFT